MEIKAHKQGVPALDFKKATGIIKYFGVILLYYFLMVSKIRVVLGYSVVTKKLSIWFLCEQV